MEKRKLIVGVVEPIWDGQLGTVRFGFGSSTEVMFEFGLKDRKSAKFGSMSIKKK